MSKLAGKVAVVTGASKGIGAGIAKGLAAAGASVVVNYASSKDNADAVVRAISEAGGNAVAVHGDVSQADQSQKLIEASVKAFGRLDILVNNAGILGMSPIDSFSEDQFRRMFDINVLSHFLTIQAALKYLTEGASIINISSNVTSKVVPQSSIYTATKSAVDAMTRVLAKELGPRQIRVNVINPGLTLTEGVEASELTPAYMEAMARETPLGRVGKPDDIAAVAVFLASDDARWLTGERLFVSGGLR